MSCFVKTRYRKVNFATVGTDKDNIIKDLSQYEARSMHGQLPIIWNKAKGCQVWDIHGNKFIDFTSTIFVTNSGHANWKVRLAILKQIFKPLIHAYTYPTKVRRDYLKKLIQTLRGQFGVGCAEKAFLMSSGTEAVECAIKLMRMNGGKKRKKIISFTGNWHGRTMGAQMLSSNEKQKEWIGYKDPNIVHLPFPYPWITTEEGGGEFFHNCMEESKVDPNKIAGFVLETYQGWACAFYPRSFVDALSLFAEKHNILVTWDEIQSGFGRTGRMFGFQHYERYLTELLVQPKVDLICCGKGISSGYPLSAVIGWEDLLDLPEVGSMSSTHSANPVSCAAGLSNLKVLSKPGFISEIVRKGFLMETRLKSLKDSYKNYVTGVYGNGMVWGIHFRDAELAKNIAHRCMLYGLIVVATGRESIKIAPPLTIPFKALDEGLFVFEKVVSEFAHE